jgi:hypothetical protein
MCYEWPLSGAKRTFQFEGFTSAFDPQQIAITAKVDVRARWRFHFIDVSNCFPGCIIGRMKPRGLYRERNGWGNQDSARVKYDEHQELDVSEDTYRARDYQPPFDELPWKDEPANDA